MRIALAAQSAAAAMAVPAVPAAAQGRAANMRAEQPWRSSINVCRRDAAPASGGLQESRRESAACSERPLAGLILPEDVPADLRRRSFEGRTELDLLIGEDGRVRECRIVAPSGEPRFDAIACPRVQERGRFRPFLVAPGRPVATRWSVTVFWWITNEPPVPTMVPFVAVPPPFDPSNSALRRWPRLSWGGGLEPATLPRIQADFPADARRDGTVSLDLVVTPESGVGACIIGVGSGDPALDAASCAVARRVDLVYSRPCEQCPSANVPLQIVWRRRGGSHVRFPLPLPRLGEPPLMDPADTRPRDAQRLLPVPLAFALAPEDYRGIGDLKITNPRPWIDVAVGADGRARSCRPRISSGNRAVDQRSCELILRRARYRPQTDAFGDPVAGPPYGHMLDLSVLE